MGNTNSMVRKNARQLEASTETGRTSQVVLNGTIPASNAKLMLRRILALVQDKKRIRVFLLCVLTGAWEEAL